jgi:alpha-galactosidase
VKSLRRNQFLLGCVVMALALVVPVPATGAPATSTPPQPTTAARLATPPMGWNDWNHFGCGITEQVVRETADSLVRTGLRDAGYRYVNVDDCWEAGTRDSEGRLASDPKTFPGGIKALADYVHARGLHFGIYTAAGDKTCQGRPASGGHYPQDAATFADWGVDYVKLDWCGAKGDPHELTTGFRAALDATGRSMVLGVSRHGSPWLWPDRPADLWRTSADVDDQWSSVLRNTEEEAGLADRAGRGRGWNDPDMLQVGNGGMSTEEYRAHLSLWSVLAAPLLMGNDVRRLDATTLDLLGNREVIAVDQDALGRPGERVRTDGDREIWARPLAGGDAAVVLFNRGAVATEIRTTAGELGLPKGRAHGVRDLWTHQDNTSAGTIAADVPPHGAVMLRVSTAGAQATPRATLTADAGYLPAGTTTTVAVTLRADGESSPVRLGLRGPDGWTIRPLAQATADSRSQRPARAEFAVTVPAGTAPGTGSLTLSADYRRDGAAVHQDTAHAVVVPPPAPNAPGALSDHARVETDNGWYLPMKIDHSFGADDFCGDCTGGTLTLGGRSFHTGLGTYASSQVSYYLGARCRSVDLTVGVDDEVGSMTWPRPQNTVGTARFSVFADHRLVYDSGVRIAGGPPGQVRLDLRGVRQLKLVSDSAGDGNFLDHADWADTKADCGR